MHKVLSVYQANSNTKPDITATTPVPSRVAITLSTPQGTVKSISATTGLPDQVTPMKQITGLSSPSPTSRSRRVQLSAGSKVENKQNGLSNCGQKGSQANAGVQVR